MSNLEEKTFDITNLDSRDPFAQFKSWYEAAQSNSSIEVPDSMCLSTSTLDGKSTCRMMSMKNFDDKGFKFFTKYDSKKALDLNANPYACMCFYWGALDRQLIISGRVEKLSREESEKCFHALKFERQVTSFVSNQDKQLKNKQSLFDKYYLVSKEYESTGQVPMPENWGGYVLIPDEFEFFQSNVNYLDDRIKFVRNVNTLDTDFVVSGENGWFIERLSP